ncbi:hypothetical protein F442_06437 [Phytophthora nicotianae P10297]|uniref:Bromo domain-containing protein n=2 Tax=Phytophthora nicotianae P10297 TaxID=1317064 RepID=W2ZKT4_PHYNI|nr:hypothetical protein F442_06437 [Phytophthora nicotianae P10297]
MSSSSSSGYSDEDLEASAPSAAAPSASELSHAVELAQICSFCTTFRQPLRLPSFSRTALQEAILGASNGDMTHVELLAELHFKLAREHPTAKMEKMVQDWEKTLARKLQDNWRKEFTANPMGGGVTYARLTVFERVKILDALCHWKLDTCAEIHKHIANLQKENDNEGIKKLRAGEIGTDDKGVSYWYFDDGCWIYAEDKPRWQLEDRKPSYVVEFASAKRIRLSINFDPDQDSSAPPLRLPVKSVAFADEVKEEKMKKEVAQCSSDSKVKSESVSTETVKLETTVELVKTEKEESTLVSVAKEVHVTTDETAAAVKEEASHAAQTPTARRMDINALCASVSPLSEEAGALHQSNGSIQTQGDDNVSKSAGLASVSITTTRMESPRSPDKQEDTTLCDKKATASNEEKTSSKSPGKESPVKIKEDNAGDHTHPSVVAIVGSKKRTIIDDDSSDSDVDLSKETTDKKVESKAASSPPPRKKRKASIENTSNAAALSTDTIKDESMELVSTQLNGTTASQESHGDTQVSKGDAVAKETRPVVSKAGPVPTIVKDLSSPSSKVNAEAKEPSPSTAVPKDSSEETGNTEAKKPEDSASQVTPSGPASTSPTDPAAAPESFDITCESCKKCYDMRYVDPPLVERPTEEWRCFECLVNDARGWPRRRKSTPRETFSPREDESSSRRRSSSSKSRSGSSSKKSKKSSSKSRSSSSSKKKSSHSSSSKRKSSSSKSSSSKKSSSSSSKKHKKRKSSSSSHHSSHGHHRRRHHYHAEFAKLVTLFRERQEQRLGIEEARINGDLQMAFDEAPQGWRVVSSTLDDLRALIESLSGGSLEQDRLRGRLILIMKEQEKQEEERRKQQELAWNILPRRQSSRIAIGRMKNQSTQESDVEDRYSDDDGENRRPGLRSRRSPDGVDDRQKHDRAWRARRRHQGSDDEDVEDEDDELDSNGVTAGNWIDWSLLKGNTRALSTVCLALVNRLLKEEAAELFSRPVDPGMDGCPNYLSVITHPIDLGTIRSRVEAKFYRKWELFKKDVELVWQNCRTFNAPDTLVVQFADTLSKLSRSMCIAAEKKGVDRMKDRRSEDEESGNESEDIMSDASKAESRSSINKAWTESSASESSDSSDGSSSDGDSDSDAASRKRRPSRSSSKKPQTRARSTKSSRTSRPANKRSSRSTRTRSSRKRSAPTSSSEDESSASEDAIFSPVRKNPRPSRASVSKSKDKVDPPTEDEDFSADDKAVNRPPPPQNGAPSPSPPPPPPPQVAQKRPKPRLIVSDSSSSDSSDSDDNSSSSASSDSDGSDSDARPANKPQPPPPSAAEAPAPPPPSPPPPAASPEDSKPPVRPSPSHKTKPKTAATQGKKKASPTAETGYTHSPALLNSYLSSSSSSSDFSSGDSDSSDGDSDSD